MRSVLLLAALLSGPAFGQKVYKCTDERGTTVFSQRPCSADPSKVSTVDTSSALKTGTGGSVAEQGEFAAMNEVDRRCRVRLDNIAGTYAGRRQRIANDIAALEAQAANANNNLAGATFESGLRQQIAGLAAERGALASAEAQEMQAAREQCRIEREAEQARIDDARAERERRAAAEAEAAAAKAEAAAAKTAPADDKSE